MTAIVTLQVCGLGTERGYPKMGTGIRQLLLIRKLAETWYDAVGRKQTRHDVP